MRTTVLPIMVFCGLIAACATSEHRDLPLGNNAKSISSVMPGYRIVDLSYSKVPELNSYEEKVYILSKNSGYWRVVDIFSKGDEKVIVNWNNKTVAVFAPKQSRSNSADTCYYGALSAVGDNEISFKEDEYNVCKSAFYKSSASLGTAIANVYAGIMLSHMKVMRVNKEAMASALQQSNLLEHVIVDKADAYTAYKKAEPKLKLKKYIADFNLANTERDFRAFGNKYSSMNFDPKGFVIAANNKADQMYREKTLVGAKICKSYEGYTFVGYVESKSPDLNRIQIRVAGTRSGIVPYGWRPSIIWDEPINWALCAYKSVMDNP